MEEPMTEDISTQTTAPESATATSDQSYGEILAGEAEAPLKTDASVKTEELTNPEVSNPVSDEIILEIAGKEYSIKQAELNEFLENRSKFAEREKAITEKEKSMNRDYTQKTQQVAEFRKSVESTFGRFPQNDEMQALGKVWQAYFKSPQAKHAIDSIISGRQLSGNEQAQPQDEKSAYVSQLEQEIFDLKEKFNNFTTTQEERERTGQLSTAKKTWDGWAAEKAKVGVKITDEIDAKMSPFISALKQAHPDWDSNQILDEAYEHATIKDTKNKITSQVLQDADTLKQKQIPRIKPKAPGKPDSEKTYSEIILDR